MSKDNTERLNYFISLLDEYLDGQLSDEKNIEIKKAIDIDPYLHEVLKQHVQARANIRIAGEAELKNKFLRNFDTIEKKPNENKNPILLIIALALILSLGLFTYLFIFSTDKKSEESTQIMASADVPPSEMLLTNVEDPSYDLLRSDRDTLIADTWQKAVQSFISKNYLSTLTILKDLEKDSSFVKNHFGKYKIMKGVAHLKQEEYQDAIHALSSISPQNPYFDQAEWYLALTYYYKNDMANTELLLKQIINNNTHFKKEQAIEIMNSIMK